MNIAEKLRISISKPGKDEAQSEVLTEASMGSAKQVEAQVTDHISASIRKARRLTETLDRAIIRGA